MTNRVLPVIPLRGFVIYPQMVINFDVGRKPSIQAVEKAMIDDDYILLAVQEEAAVEEPTAKDISPVGTVAKIKQVMKLPGGVIRVLVDAEERALIHGYNEEETYIEAKVETGILYDKDENYGEALVKSASDTLEKYADVAQIAPDTMLNMITSEDPESLADLIAANLPFSFDKKMDLLKTVNPYKRLEKVILYLAEEIKIAGLQKDIQSKVKSKINKTQKDFYLREQMKAIQDALGESQGVQGEIEEYLQKLDELGVPDYVSEKVRKELKRLENMGGSSSEAGVIRTYIDTVLDLPWNKFSKETVHIDKAEKILDRDHYGLQKVKERILEFMAVKQFASEAYSPILCLVGPPGVGKTSIASSIAESVGREYVRISLGGVRDESEIRGHRKTYVGAMPGRLINAYKQAGTSNPLILLDEIDKLSGDFKGDPTSALLEVLDPEQNSSFRDHYLELDYDLSKTMFVATANDVSRIPRPLLDRMELIMLQSYTEQEKKQIAINYLMPKQLKRHGMKKGHVRLAPEVYDLIINHYTKEAGVRNLERTLSKLIRKSAKIMLSNEKSYVKVTPKNLEEFLGIKTYRYDKINDKEAVGIVRGLAWTAVGGDTLSVEVNVMKGKGNLQLTGKLGDVMKESARTAVSYIRSKADTYNIPENFYKEKDIHIHIPEGAVPKDGPSAGITMATAMISALTGIPVKHNVAMTGEITLRGRVLPIGGLKEKILAAKRAGIVKVLVPVDNQKDVVDLDDTIVEGIDVYYMETMDDVLPHALTQPITKENV